MVFSIKNVAIASAFLSVAQGAVMGKRALSGQATSYGGNTNGGACSFSTYTLPSNILGTALSDSNWATAANCGRCVSVTGPSGNNITAMITDECPGCGTNHLDLYQNAFTKLAALSVGIIDITWDYVPCPITTPLQVHLKEGVSAYWFSMQVVNAAEGVSKLEVSTDGSKTWKSTTRTTYNFFENSSGFGTTSVDVRVTGLSGSTVIIKNVAVTPGLVVTASGNLKSGSTGSAKTVVPATVSSTSSEVDTVEPVVAADAVATPSTSPVAAVSTPDVVATPASSPSPSVAEEPTPESEESDECDES